MQARSKEKRQGIKEKIPQRTKGAVGFKFLCENDGWVASTGDVTNGNFL
jgi:hypothetical protein